MSLSPPRVSCGGAFDLTHDGSARLVPGARRSIHRTSAENPAEITTEVGWLAMFAGNALLIIGSLLPGI